MPTILVVDDSAVDRRMAGGLLEKEGDLSIQYAAHGKDALTQIERAIPDLVLTDMIMPEMDGLALVSAVRERFPLVPVILTTSQGSEEIAAQALRVGAASYVPKRLLAQELSPTVRTVLALSRRQQTHHHLMACMSQSDYTFCLASDGQLVSSLVGYLQDSAALFGFHDESERMRVGIALDEALANAIIHGNLEVTSELREVDHAAYHAMIEQRRQLSPYRERQVQVQAKLSREGAVFVVRDQGPGFDPSKLPDPTDPANLEKASGRGVLLMRTFMDEVEYNSTGNEVTMVKRWKK